MSPMSTAQFGLAAVQKGDNKYVFGGCSGRYLRLVERYSNIDNAWELLPEMEEQRGGHYAIAGSGDDIYIVGGADISESFKIFDTASLLWKSAGPPHEMSGKKYAVAVLLKDQYLVNIGGWDEDSDVTADCLIYDIWSKDWSVTQPSIDILTRRDDDLTADALDEKVVVAGGLDGKLDSEFIDIDDLLEYAPLHVLSAAVVSFQSNT